MCCGPIGITWRLVISLVLNFVYCKKGGHNIWIEYESIMHKRHEVEHKFKILLSVTLSNSFVSSRLLYVFGFIFLIPRQGKKGERPLYTYIIHTELYWEKNPNTLNKSFSLEILKQFFCYFYLTKTRVFFCVTWSDDSSWISEFAQNVCNYYTKSNKC